MCHRRHVEATSKKAWKRCKRKRRIKRHSVPGYSRDILISTSSSLVFFFPCSLQHLTFKEEERKRRKQKTHQASNNHLEAFNKLKAGWVLLRHTQTPQSVYFWSLVRIYKKKKGKRWHRRGGSQENILGGIAKNNCMTAKLAQHNALRWRHSTTGGGGSGVRRTYFGSGGRGGRTDEGGEEGKTNDQSWVKTRVRDMIAEKARRVAGLQASFLGLRASSPTVRPAVNWMWMLCLLKPHWLKT